MLDRKTVFEIHHLQNQSYSVRSIARLLKLNRETVAKYLNNPEQVITKRSRSSKLLPYCELIDDFLKEDQWVKAPVILQRISSVGFDGEITILRNYLRKKRYQTNHRQAFIRFESKPGQQLQIDWGHFGSLNYGATKRKLYALAVVESYSRMFYVEFTHSQKQQVLHECLLNAFKFFGGAPAEIIVDNMLTAVTERQSFVVRFNDGFLDFLRPFAIMPKACNVCAPYEKGKIEKLIQYLRRNFWPLRHFTCLEDVQAQANKWLREVANIRLHQTTGQRPAERFKEVTLRHLPEFLPDCRETEQLKVYKDFALRFDGNFYTVPPWTIGKRLTLKADSQVLTIYHKQRIVAVHGRSWERRKRIELPQHKEMVKKLQKKLWQDRHIAAFASLGETARNYLSALSKANQPIKKNIARLLQLKDRYGAPALLTVLEKVLHYKAYGAEYVENILHQQMTARSSHPPVKLKQDALNKIRLQEPCLADYDSLVLQRRKKDD